MREGKIGIACRRALQKLVGADIRRQKQVDGRYILLHSLGGGRGDRQIEAVLHFLQLPVLVRATTVALLIIRQENVSGGAAKRTDGWRVRDLGPIDEA